MLNIDFYNPKSSRKFFTTQEAIGFPFHPNCKCITIPLII